MTNFSSICIVLISIYVDTLSALLQISVSGPVGSTAVLPCELSSVDTDRQYIRWGIDSDIIFERLGEKTFQAEGYEGRVDVSVDKLHKGDCSLFLHNLRLTDAGIYTSYEAVRSTRLSLHSGPKELLISRVELSVYGEVSPLKETDSSIAAAPTGDAVMKSPHPLVLVLSLVSCSLVQLFCDLQLCAGLCVSIPHSKLHTPAFTHFPVRTQQ